MPEAPLTSVLLRLAATAGIILLCMLLFRALNLLVLARARGRARLPGPILAADAHSAPITLLYFTTPFCAPCKTIQQPAIQRLREQVGDAVTVIEIDASQQPEVASQWGVLSVPTTFVLDGRGNPRHVNHGVTSADKLLRQISDIS